MGHLATAIEILKTFKFEEDRGPTMIVKEPIGVCGFITPWNWPLNQIVCKVAPAIATGCTMVLKPSEVAPFSGHIFAEIMHAAGVPAGVFNLVNGDGPTVGAAHVQPPGRGHGLLHRLDPRRDRGGQGRRRRPSSAWRQELGGKSPNIVLDDDAFAKGVGRGVARDDDQLRPDLQRPHPHAGPQDAHGRGDHGRPRGGRRAITVGDPNGNGQLGPVVNKAQFDKIQTLIQTGHRRGRDPGHRRRPAGPRASTRATM